MQTPSDFAKLMEELGLPCQPTRISGKDSAPVQPPADISTLSIQAKKALRPKSNATEAQSERISPKVSMDGQGNRVRISREADSLSAAIRQDVAWETRIWPESPLDSQNPDKS